MYSLIKQTTNKMIENLFLYRIKRNEYFLDSKIDFIDGNK